MVGEMMGVSRRRIRVFEGNKPKKEKIKTFDESVAEFKSMNRDLHESQARQMQANIDIHKICVVTHAN